ncbi:class I SAM-dependent methyltransferase [Roseivirga pacifica]|uniref:class I SAM-dependent methyltransferase n=1 Tax=Roseivirga pacifica TaxID=1267423 RepID=UPI002095C418|nr:class I SAM-dependent methyltransferase [Roseivirga pacifica]MCO6361042.1 methyltransferase domain-containing protein [Roseivirga pacifica]MCO6368931.1 methyltransferase domain-containing protein [Roseivirga pacifica]MCO6373074.1 methyltransferase domain-containing protein [Roseivirga pacifica]MCO6373154.1 methyltransferase domain-containing protein [Roseivirga pacifica]MCO6377589.1 methyltransferase domain-containing protein [Roseivirga pacifica]
MEVEKQDKLNTVLIPEKQANWQGRPEWFFNRAHTDTYELWYEGRYKRAEVWQKKVMEQLVSKDPRVKTLLEFGCGTTRFTRWWKEIGIEATGGDISPLMLSQAIHLFDGDLVNADSHHMPFKDNTFDALAFITTFEYYKDPVQVIREAARVARCGIAMGMMNRNSPKVARRRVQQVFGKNPFYVTATFYTPAKLMAIIDEALKGRDYTVEWTCTGLPKWFPVQQWNVPVGDFFGLYVQLND